MSNDFTRFVVDADQQNCTWGEISAIVFAFEIMVCGPGGLDHQGVAAVGGEFHGYLGFGRGGDVFVEAGLAIGIGLV